MLKTYTGGCHCGAIRYAADIDLSRGTSKCNCSFCSKARLWGVIVKPAAFRLLAGERELLDYYKPDGAVHHLFCRACGIRSFERGHLDVLGGDFVTVNVSCLEDLDLEELVSVPVTYKNGRENKWFVAPTHTWHL